MGHKIFISYKHRDLEYKQRVQALPNLDVVDRSLNEPIDSDDEDYIMRKIREDYLSDSTVTVHLIGAYSSESLGWDMQRFIKRELQASLYDSASSTKSGILGVVLPSVTSTIYQGTTTCLACGSPHNLVKVNDSTTVREFSYNYYLPNSKCSHAEHDRYCVLYPWDEFISDANHAIDRAFQKRSDPIASKTKVRP